MRTDDAGVVLAEERVKHDNETTRARRTQLHEAQPVASSDCERYAELTEEGGHLDKMRASSRPATVKIALCGTKHAFAYTRQVTKSLPSDFCREAEERIGAWMRGLRTDILRERHQTREHEDAIVAAIVQVLPLFDTLASVREASCLLNSLSASERRGEAGRRVRPSQYTRVRDYVMVEVARANAQRSG
ncbi:hypothetical protein LSAT2_020406, partial [Lamellibrachia satsuma]